MKLTVLEEEDDNLVVAFVEQIMEAARDELEREGELQPKVLLLHFDERGEFRIAAIPVNIGRGFNKTDILLHLAAFLDASGADVGILLGDSWLKKDAREAIVATTLDADARTMSAILCYDRDDEGRRVFDAKPRWVDEQDLAA